MTTENTQRPMDEELVTAVYGRQHRWRVEAKGQSVAELAAFMEILDKVVQRIPVKILFDKGQDPTHLLRPGMSVVPTVRIR